MSYPFRKIEKKWQKIWEKKNLWEAKDFSKKPKIYILDMFPYISGEGLHVGHVEGYTATDILARFYRMNGYNVLHPMGWDAFGLPTENFAIKKKKNPIDFVPKFIDRFKKQIKSLGFSYDWKREISTIDPNYYKWTQYMFLQMYEKGLIYEKEAPINFCPSCKTGLADEEVVGGKCERCGSVTEIRNLKQWHIKITAYADRLLEDLENLDWPENVKEMQKNWIGKSEGYEIDFQIENQDKKINVFTTRVDTIYGVTFLALSIDHPLALKITIPDYYENIENYIKKEILKEKTLSNKDKDITGVFTGSYAIHPLTKKKIPVWVTNYVLSEYGSGAIMGVPAHDERDYKFARKFNLEIIQVIKSTKAKNVLPYTKDGLMINSEEFNGLNNTDTKEKIGEKLILENIARKTVHYKLRDWIFSRQRYWGEPIPLIKCQNCGVVPLKEKDLPLKLPYVKKYQPTGTGESPLKNIKNWIEVTCPKCKSKAERENQTMPQWAGSCWYYLRYIDPKNRKTFADYKKLKYWLPVNWYIGGVEHAVLHLLYARFWHKFLYDIKLVPTNEPFQKLFNQGLILGPDGQKMSKSKGNVINPDDVIKEYGADTLRMYEMFLGPLEDAKPWSMESIKGIFRFLNRVWFLAKEIKKAKKDLSQEEIKELEKELNLLIYEATEGIKKLRFNVVIAKFMVFEDSLRKINEEKKKIPQEIFLTFITLLFPFAPHLSQEIWSFFNKKSFLDNQPWPTYNEKLLKQRTNFFIIQVNGKKRGILKSDKETLNEKEILTEIKKLNLYQNFIKGKKIEKIIFVKGKIINFVVK